MIVDFCNSLCDGSVLQKRLSRENNTLANYDLFRQGIGLFIKLCFDQKGMNAISQA